MDNTESLMRLYELLGQELKRIVDKGSISPAELENAYKAVCLMEKIDEMTGMDSGYSETGYSYDDHWRSGRRGRSPVTGRYISRNGRSMRSMNENSGHSIKDRMISRLEHMMDETDSDYERDEISSYIRKLEMSK